MIPDKTYRIEPVTVYRLIDEEGKVIFREDDWGPLHFGSYTEALEDLRARRWLPFQGPLTEADQKRADEWYQFGQMLRQQSRIKEILQAKSIPSNSNKTITFFHHDVVKQDEGFEPGERGNA